MGHQRYALFCTETTVPNHPVVFPKSSCTVHLLRCPWLTWTFFFSGEEANDSSVNYPPHQMLEQLKKMRSHKQNTESVVWRFFDYYIWIALLLLTDFHTHLIFWSDIPWCTTKLQVCFLFKKLPIKYNSYPVEKNRLLIRKR